MIERIKNLRRPITAAINGHSVELLTIGHLAHAVDRSTWTVKHWQRLGLLPRPPVILNPKVPSARRGLYPQLFVRSVAIIAKQDYMYPRLDRADWPKFHAEVLRAYEKTIAPLLDPRINEEMSASVGAGE
jgi:hypothetical protein